MSIPVTISIVTYNSEKVIDMCLSSIPAGVPIIVCDNNSTDQTRDIIVKKYPHVTLIKNERNIGFGPAHNRAVSLVETPFVFLLNPDAELQEGCIEKLITASAQFPDAAILAPELLDIEENPRISYNRSIFNRSSHASKQYAEGAICAEFLSGAAMLVKKDVFREVGGFDPEIFLFYEDDDLCIKMRKAGYSCVLIPDAKLIHLSGQSSPTNHWKAMRIKYGNMAWSELYLYKKYKKNYRIRAIKEIIQCLLKSMLYGIAGKRNKFQKYYARFLGVTAFITGKKIR